METLEGIKDWRGSVVPVVNINAMSEGDEAIKHLLVPSMSYVVYKGGKFEPYMPAYLK